MIEEEGKRARRSTRFSGDFQMNFAEGGSSDEDFEVEAKKKKAASGKTKRSKECPGCGAMLAISVRECGLCDYQFTSKSLLMTQQSAAQEAVQIRDKFPFEPERDEDGSLFIEKIMGRKPRKTASKRWLKPSGVSISDLTAMDSKYDYEYLIKYKNMSYLHVQWLTAQDIEAMSQKSKAALNRYLTKLDRGDATVSEDADIDPSYMEVEKILDVREEEVQEVVDDTAGPPPPTAYDDEEEMEEEVEEAADSAPVTRRSTATSAAAAAGGGSTKKSNSMKGAAGANSSDSLMTQEDEAASSTGGGGGLSKSASMISLPSAAGAGSASGVGTDGEEGAELVRSATAIFNGPERCRQVLLKVWEDPYSISFQEPVDTELYDDYLDVVEEPICLLDVKKTLEDGGYSKFGGYKKFAQDMRKVWRNCKAYNLYKSQIWHSAHTLSMIFERLYQAWVVAYADGTLEMSDPLARPWELSCRNCLEEGNDEQMMLCDHCDAAHHIYCLRPPLKKVPDDAWMCARCIAWFEKTKAKVLSATAEEEARLLVEGAVHKKVQKVRKKKYLVKWRGLSYRDCTWETVADVNDDEKIAEYHKLNDAPPDEPPLTQAEIGLELAKERKSQLYPAGMHGSFQNPITDLDAQVYAQIRSYHFLKWNKTAPDALLKESGPLTAAAARGLRNDMALPAYLKDIIERVREASTSTTAAASGAAGGGGTAESELTTTEMTMDSSTAAATHEEEKEEERDLEEVQAERRRKLMQLDHSTAWMNFGGGEVAPTGGVDAIRTAVGDLLADMTYCVARDHRKTTIPPYPSRPRLPYRYKAPSEIEVCVPRTATGLSIKAGNFNSNFIIMGFKPPDATNLASKGPLEACGRVRMGDILVAINGVYVHDLKFTRILKVLAGVTTPYLYLRFLRLPNGMDSRNPNGVTKYMNNKTVHRGSHRPLPLRSLYFGVYPSTEVAGVWVAEYFSDFRKVRVGEYADEHTAALAYDSAVRALPDAAARNVNFEVAAADGDADEEEQQLLLTANAQVLQSIVQAERRMTKERLEVLAAAAEAEEAAEENEVVAAEVVDSAQATAVVTKEALAQLNAKTNSTSSNGAASRSAASGAAHGSAVAADEGSDDAEDGERAAPLKKKTRTVVSRLMEIDENDRPVWVEVRKEVEIKSNDDEEGDAATGGAANGKKRSSGDDTEEEVDVPDELEDFHSYDSRDSDSEVASTHSGSEREENDDDEDEERGGDEWDSGGEDIDWMPNNETAENEGPMARLLRAVNESEYPPLRSDWTKYILELAIETPAAGAAGRDRKIEQIDMAVDDAVIRVWDSVAQIARTQNIAAVEIQAVLAGKSDIAGGFKWRYAKTSNTEEDANEDEESEAKKEEVWKLKLPKKSKEYKSGGMLRDYQVEGLSWLLRCWYTRRSSILADEMGLGKTVQVVTFLEHLFDTEMLRGPYLVCVPLSTIGHWKREFDLWSHMSVCLYHDVGGGRDMRDVIREFEWYYKGRSRRLLKFHVLITTYDDLTRDYEELAEIPWRVVVVDEAHRMRNVTSKLLECMRSVVTKGQVAYGYQHRILMTGTPLQNNTVELWSLLNFVEPAKFPDLEKFQERYGTISTQEQVESLQRRIAPHLLRRVKEDVAKDIPPKAETIIDVELTTMQKQYYRAIFEHNHGFLMQNLKGNMPKLMNIQMELRKCCNHPFLIAGVEINEMNTLERGMEEAALAAAESSKSKHGGRNAKKIDHNEYERRRMEETMIPSSGKMVLLDKLLPKLQREGHKVLIFSQMVKMIDLIEEYCEFRHYSCERLDGRVGGNDRQKAIDRFNKSESSFVFLLSTRAGGIGINLTAADTVVIFDSDWNPQNDIQAMARCHRIGQSKNVTIYRLITRRSFEGEMFERASKKLGLEQALLGTRNFADIELDENAKGPKLDAKEMEQLLREGAYAVLLEDDADVIKEFYEQDIDQILEQRAHVLVSEGGGGPTESWLNKRKATGRTSKSMFTGESAKEHAEIDVNDPDFWKKVLPDLVTPDLLLERLKDDSILGGGEDGDDDAARDAIEKFMRDLTMMMEGMLDLNRRNQLPERERAVCLKLLLRMTLKEDVFDEYERGQAQEWLSVMEGTRSRRARDVYVVEDIHSGKGSRGGKKGGKRRSSRGSGGGSGGTTAGKRGGRNSRGSDDDADSDGDDDDEDEDEEEDARSDDSLVRESGGKRKGAKSAKGGGGTTPKPKGGSKKRAPDQPKRTRRTKEQMIADAEAAAAAKAAKAEEAARLGISTKKRRRSTTPKPKAKKQQLTIRSDDKAVDDDDDEGVDLDGGGNVGEGDEEEEDKPKPQKKARRATTGGSGSAKKKKTAATAVQQPAVKRIRFTTKDGAVFGEDGWEDEEEDRRDDNGDDKDEEEAFDQKFEDMELDEEAEQYAPAPVTVVSAAAGRSKRNVPQKHYQDFDDDEEEERGDDDEQQDGPANGHQNQLNGSHQQDAAAEEEENDEITYL